MASSNTTQGRSMNNIIEFDGIENLNVDSIIAENIIVDNLQLQNSLFVDNTTITPQELSFIQNTSSNIQQQINNISNNFVTLDTTQTISGDKTFSGTTSLTGNLDANGISITPQEISFLDGLQSNIQTQLDNAGIGNAVTTNTDQLITGKKTFSQKINIPSVEVSDQTSVLKGFVTDTTNLAYSDIQGIIPDVNTTTIIGPGVNSPFTINANRVGTSGGEFTLTNISTPTTPIQNVDAYLSNRGSNTDNYTFENTSLIQDLSGTDFFTGLQWLSSSIVTIPIFINDFVLVKNGFDIQMVSNSGNVLPNTSEVSGYLFDSTTFITNDAIDERFLEGTGLIRPVKITSITNNRHQISSPNQITPTPSNDNVSGYFHDENSIFYSIDNGDVQTGSFIKGNNLNGSATITSKDVSLNSLTIQNNSFVTTPSLTKVGYIYFNPDNQLNGIVFEDVIGLEQFQFVVNTGITLGNHYINTLGDFTVLDTQALVPTPILRDGYLFSSSVLVSNDISLNSFIVSPPDIPDISTTRVTTVNPNFFNLSSSNNIPTPNNKTYNGFSPSETEFYYNNDDTNVEIDYYLKNNAIQIPTTDHLITSVDIVDKKLTTENLPITSPSLSVNGYANITLNKIITETVQTINVGDGIDSPLIDTGSRYVSFVNGIEIDVSGTLNTTARLFDTTGFCSQSNESIVHDPNTRLEVGNFLIDYDLNAIPVNSIISSITSLGFDIFQVGLISSLTFTPSTNTIFIDAYKLTSNTIAVNSTTLNDKVYQVSGNYRYITSQTAEPNVYNTNDSGSSDLDRSNLTYINIKLSNNQRVLLLTQKNIKTASGFFNRYLQNDTLIPAQCFVKTGNIESIVGNGTIPIIQILNSNLYQDYNFGTVNTNPFYVGATSNGVDKYIFDHFGTFLYVSGLDGPSSQSFENPGVQYYPATGDISLELSVNNDGVLTQTLDTVYTGLVFNQTGLDVSGNMGRITQFPPFFSNHVIPFQNAVTGTRDVRASVYDVGEVYNEPQIVMFGNITPNTFIFVYESSIDRYQYARVKSTLALPFNSFRYDLDRNVIIDRSTQSTVQWLTLQTTFNVNLAFPGRVFTGAKIRPSTAINIFNANPVTVPDSQVEYESITPTNINIFSSFDSYNSYEKKTFQEYIPSEFDIFNTQTVDSVIPVNYDAFEILNFNVYNLDTFIGQTFYDVGFPNNVNNETFVLKDVFQILQNKFIRDLNVLDELRLDDLNSQIRIGSTGLEILDFQLGLQNVLCKLEGDGSQLELYSDSNRNSGFKAGYIGVDNVAGFQHRSLSDIQNVAIFQTSSGSTVVNSSVGKTIGFRINNVPKMEITENFVSFFNYISSPTQPMWYFTGTGGNQNYGPNGRIGSTGFTGGQPSTRSFNQRFFFGGTNGGANSQTNFNTNTGQFFANQQGIYQFDLYVFCNNATSFTGRISLQTNAGRRQNGQFNMDVNRNTVFENCSLLQWTIFMNADNHAFFQVESSILTAFMAERHTGLRVIKLA